MSSLRNLLTSLACFLSLTFAHAGGGIIGAVTSSHGDQAYKFVVTATGPHWYADAPNPPLSARAALASARQVMDTIIPDGQAWTFSQLTLVGSDEYWYYIVTYLSPPPPGVIDDLPREFQIPVQMNGTVPTPVISDHPMKPPKP